MNVVELLCYPYYCYTTYAFASEIGNRQSVVTQLSYHIYASNALKEWKSYCKVETDLRLLPYALITDLNGNITDTLYDYNEIRPKELIKGTKRNHK